MAAIEILGALQKTPRLSPILIASKTGIDIQRVRNLLVVLLELKLVETPSRGLYQITNMGEYILRNRIECGYNG
jgi:DNA-binding IclR family transcriptional regulator